MGPAPSRDGQEPQPRPGRPARGSAADQGIRRTALTSGESTGRTITNHTWAHVDRRSQGDSQGTVAPDGPAATATTATPSCLTFIERQSLHPMKTWVRKSISVGVMAAGGLLATQAAASADVITPATTASLNGTQVVIDRPDPDQPRAATASRSSVRGVRLVRRRRGRDKRRARHDDDRRRRRLRQRHSTAATTSSCKHGRGQGQEARQEARQGRRAPTRRAADRHRRATTASSTARRSTRRSDRRSTSAATPSAISRPAPSPRPTAARWRFTRVVGSRATTRAVPSPRKARWSAPTTRMRSTAPSCTRRSRSRSTSAATPSRSSAGAFASCGGGAVAVQESAGAAEATYLTTNNYGILNGTQIVLPTQIPINICGNAIAILGGAFAHCGGGAIAVQESATTESARDEALPLVGSAPGRFRSARWSGRWPARALPRSHRRWTTLRVPAQVPPRVTTTTTTTGTASTARTTTAAGSVAPWRSSAARPSSARATSAR